MAQLVLESPDHDFQQLETKAKGHQKTVQTLILEFISKLIADKTEAKAEFDVTEDPVYLLGAELPHGNGPASDDLSINHDRYLYHNGEYPA